MGLAIEKMLADLRERVARGQKSIAVTSVLSLAESAVEEESAAEMTGIEVRPGYAVIRRASKIVGKRDTGVPVFESADLVGVQEAARLLGVDNTRPAKWRIRKSKFGPEGEIEFPLPVAELSTGPIFLRTEVEALRPFVEERRRPPSAKK